jgi:alkanesulfonate monooxygenase SsuD/methylene tetrahydromethanopterin reductase-like flavin-dependent oxidoreductase (luciferase family)
VKGISIMDVGFGTLFPGSRDGRKSDYSIYKDEIALAILAEDLGYDSVWATEHHFTHFQITPDPLQILTYIAAQTSKVKLGTDAVILPWNDPTRVAERVTVLDNLSDGRCLVAVGRGLGEVEFLGFGVPMAEARPRFVEAAEMLRDGLETGFIESSGPFFARERRELRPRAEHSFRNRLWAAAISPESFDAAAELGFGLLCQPQKPWDTVHADTLRYWEAYTRLHNEEPVGSVNVSFVYCDRDRVKARDQAQRYIGDYYQAVMEHYDLKGSHFAKTSGYEYYEKSAQRLRQAGDSSAQEFYTGLQVWGTPNECVEKIMHIREVTRCDTFVGNFNYSDIPIDDVRNVMCLFASDVLPQLQSIPQKVA